MDVTTLINKIKGMEYYWVRLEITEPIQFNGVVPFDVTITENFAVFKVLAHSYEEAEEKVFKFMWSSDEE